MATSAANERLKSELTGNQPRVLMSDGLIGIYPAQ